MAIKYPKYIEKKYSGLISKAMGIYNRVVWGHPNVTLVSAKLDDGGLNISVNKGNKINIVRFNDLGQLAGYGAIVNPYLGPIPEKKVEELNKAIGLFKQSIKLCPTKGSAFKWLGRTYQFLTLYEEAVDCYKEAIKLNPAYRKDLTYRIIECGEQKKGKQYLIVAKEKLE